MSETKADETVYVATEPLYVGRSRAANIGDRIPAGHLVKHPSWADKVKIVGAPDAAPAATVETTLEPVVPAAGSDVPVDPAPEDTTDGAGAPDDGDATVAASKSRAKQKA